MHVYPEEFDVLVVGSGHAGVEAALASARIGCRTLVLTQNLDTIAQMSCNPAIGGSAKGHMVKEIDALGGAMGINADATGIQFRRLNKSKGPAVWATRVQCDKKAYQFRMKAVLERTPNLEVLQGGATRILVNAQGEVYSVETDLGMEVRARSVVITAGTFLGGLLHVGEQSKPGGRMADGASRLSDSVRELGFVSGRFKTGTPCRINGRSIDFGALERQEGDSPAPRFSFLDSVESFPDDVHTLNFGSDGLFHVEQMPCFLSATSSECHEIIRANLDRSPLYQRRIEGTGPRYCPSIEDKVVRFAEKESHQIFLEPEGRHSNEYYVNGVSTSLPFDVQLRFIRAIRGLGRAEIIRPGYAVEYDYFPPTQLKPTLETKLVPRLFFAGQINGTSGYEEAAGQGLVAGANAALTALGRGSFTLDPSQSYIGVLIQDLITRGTTEPYRMFTSRAEHRLVLREDNADLRLTDLAAGIGLVGANRVRLVQQRRAAISEAMAFASKTAVGGRNLLQTLRDPLFTLDALPPGALGVAARETWEFLQADLRYEGYVSQASKRKSNLRRSIPHGIDFADVPGLRTETRQKLQSVRPQTLQAVAAISGITSADVSILDIWLSRR